MSYIETVLLRGLSLWRSRERGGEKAEQTPVPVEGPVRSEQAGAAEIPLSPAVEQVDAVKPYRAEETAATERKPPVARGDAAEKTRGASERTEETETAEKPSGQTETAEGAKEQAARRAKAEAMLAALRREAVPSDLAEIPGRRARAEQNMPPRDEREVELERAEAHSGRPLTQPGRAYPAEPYRAAGFETAAPAGGAEYGWSTPAVRESFERAQSVSERIERDARRYDRGFSLLG